MRSRVVVVSLVVSLGWLALPGAQAPSLAPAEMRRVGEVDARYVSYNVEMVEVTGGRFWAPYRSEGTPAAQTPTTAAVPGLDPSAFRMRPPIDLASARLRGMARRSGPPTCA